MRALLTAPWAAKVPLIGCNTEGRTTSLAREIEDLFQKHPQKDSVLHSWVNDVNAVYRQSRIVLIPTTVDETFCRVVWEAMMCGCAVLVSGRGNTCNLFEDGKSGFLVPSEMPQKWVEETRRVYRLPPKRLRALGEAAQAFARKLLVRSQLALDRAVRKTIGTSWRSRVGLFTTWNPQGLGFQAKRYSEVLQEIGFEVFVLSFAPYHGKNYPWHGWKGPSVTFSPNVRERVTDEEVKAFLDNTGVGALLIPEICFQRVFEVSDLCRERGVKVVAVPNIEICRRSEMPRYRACFDVVLANNRLTTRVLRDNFGVSTTFLGYAQGPSFAPNKDPKTRRRNSFLVVGGVNPFYRKNVHKVLAAFANIPKKLKFFLTITVNTDPAKLPTNLDRRIRLVNRHVSDKDLQDMYASHEYYIHLSTNEGLGLNLFEARVAGMEMVTFDTAPYNEVFEPRFFPNSRFLPTNERTMLDNPEAIIPRNDFDVPDLRGAVLEILQRSPNSPKSTGVDEVGEEAAFKERFREALRF